MKYKVWSFIKQRWLGLFYLVVGLLLIFSPQLTTFFQTPINFEQIIKYKLNIIVGLGIAVVALLYLLFYLLNIRELCVIKVDGMNEKTIPYEGFCALGKKTVHPYTITLEKNYNKTSIYSTVCKVEAAFEAHHSQNNNFDYYYYYGYTYTPFIFLLGFLHGNNKKYYCFHMIQEGENPKRIRLPRKAKIKNELKCELCEKNSDTLIIKVATSTNINNIDTKQFGKADEINIYSEKSGFDVIDSQETLVSWCKTITDAIRGVYVRKYKRINLLLATSSELTFLLGKTLSKNEDVPVFVYHYDASLEHKYAWAIAPRLKGEAKVSIFDDDNWNS